MIKFGKRDKRTNLEKEIENVILAMGKLEASSKEYSTMAANLELLHKAQTVEVNRKQSRNNAILVFSGNLIGIVLILCYEQASSITSKAVMFVGKGRV